MGFEKQFRPSVNVGRSKAIKGFVHPVETITVATTATAGAITPYGLSNIVVGGTSEKKYPFTLGNPEAIGQEKYIYVQSLSDDSTGEITTESASVFINSTNKRKLKVTAADQAVQLIAASLTRWNVVTPGSTSFVSVST